MGNENLTPPSVSEMIRMTADNSVVFMQQVAEHIDKLEASVLQLQHRIAELEGKTDVK
jgi:hypothetical protein